MAESWLSRESVLTQPVSQPLSKRAVTEERRVIETALARPEAESRDPRARQPAGRSCLHALPSLVYTP